MHEEAKQAYKIRLVRLERYLITKLILALKVYR
jgi:hypothetical protein